MLNELALFAGAGGGILGGKLLGWRTVCAVECEAYPASVLVQRQNDGILEPFPIWDNVTTFDGKPWKGLVDVVSGGFPCQDISAAGKGAGIEGSRSGLWSEMARIIGEVRSRFVFVENSPLLVSRGLETVLRDLASMGYDAQWCIVSASNVGAPHKRERIWICAHSDSVGHNGRRESNERGLQKISGNRPGDGCEKVADAKSRKSGQPEAGNRGEGFSRRGKEVANAGKIRRDAGRAEQSLQRPWQNGKDWKARDRKQWWPAEPEVGRVANGLASRVDRLKAIGNGQVPRVAATAWKLLNHK